MGRDKSTDVGVANTSAGHTTLLKECHHTLSSGPLLKPIAIILDEGLVLTRVREGRPDFVDVDCHLGLHLGVHAQHGKAVLRPLVLRHENNAVALANPGGLIFGDQDVV